MPIDFFFEQCQSTNKALQYANLQMKKFTACRRKDERIWEEQSQFVVKAMYMCFDHLFKSFF